MTTPAPHPPALLAPAQAAEYLCLSICTLVRMRASGKGPPFVRMGDCPKSPIRYRLADLDAWIAGRVQVHATSAPGVIDEKPRDLVTPPVRPPRMPPVRRRKGAPPPSTEVPSKVSRAVSQALDEGLMSSSKILGRASKILKGPDLDALEAAAATVVTLEAGWHADDVGFAVASAAMEDAPDLAEGALAKLHKLDAKGHARQLGEVAAPAKRRRRG